MSTKEVRDFERAQKRLEKALEAHFQHNYEDDPLFKPIKKARLQKQSGGVYLHLSGTKGAGGRKVSSAGTRASSFRRTAAYTKGSGLSTISKFEGVVHNTAEAVIKFDRAGSGIKTARHLKEAALYIARNGLVDVENNDGWELNKEVMKGMLEGWEISEDLPADKDDPRYTDKLPAAARRMILSAPPGTDHKALTNTARQFGHEFFAVNGFEYVFVLHAKTDATPNEPDHPHVHFLIKAVNDEGKRLNPNKGDLRTMRERYAAIARENGIELNATRRIERMKYGRGKSSERIHLERRTGQITRQAPPTAIQKAMVDAAEQRMKEVSDAASDLVRTIDALEQSGQQVPVPSSRLPLSKRTIARYKAAQARARAARVETEQQAPQQDLSETSRDREIAEGFRKLAEQIVRSAKARKRSKSDIER